jgi:hypothetical protein
VIGVQEQRARCRDVSFVLDRINAWFIAPPSTGASCTDLTEQTAK